MKKIIAILFLIFCIEYQSFSDPIDKSQAQFIAESFFNAGSNDLKTGNGINQIIVEKYKGVESFYIYGFKNGGFVIVAADDYAAPILGYSYTSTITDQIGSNTRYLFDQYNKEIADVKHLKSKSKKIIKEWDKLKSSKSSGTIKATGPLLTTTWNQSPYYNQFCPSGTPTGCVATAMSQIMNYHKWPINGNGWNKYISSDHPEYGELYADFSSETYDWDNMPGALLSGTSATKKNAVATLCYHAGVAVNMNYGPSGSGASSADVLYALSSYFKYDPLSIEIVTYTASQKANYLNKIKTEINNNRPIYYDGSDSITHEGHAWVCDGYDDNDLVHINWGWGGAYNGYFLLSDMAPGSYDFTGSNAMIIGIQPGSGYQDMMWTKQASSLDSASRGVQYISVIDERTAWAVVYDGSVNNQSVKEYTRTTDGNTWNSGIINAAGTNGMDNSMISAVDKDNAWVALYDGTNGGGRIVKTSNGGQTWVVQSTAAFAAPDGFPNVVHFWDLNNGWCQGDPNGGYFEMYTTTNGGTTWTRVPQGNIPSKLSGEYGNVGAYDVYGNYVWFATNKGRIFKSTDKGSSWTVYQTPISNATFELSFKNQNTGIIQVRSSTDHSAYITNDGGQSWTKLVTTGNFYTNSFKYIPGTDLLISTGSDFTTPFQGISYSTDDGVTFKDYANCYKNFQFLAIGAAGLNSIWVGGYNSDKYTDGMWHYGYKLNTIDFTFNKRTVCLNDSSIVFQDLSLDSYDTYEWEFGEGASPSTITGAGPHVVKYTTAGSKSIKLRVILGAEKDSIVKKNLIYVSGSKPNAAGIISGSTAVNQREKHTYFVADQDNVSFIWDIPNTWYGGSQTNMIDITFDSAGTKNISVTPRNGCGDGNSSNLQITAEATVGIDNPVKGVFNIYPNPSQDYFRISGIENSEIHIYDISGRMVKSIKNYQENEAISTEGLQSGIYYIQILVNNQSFTKSINILK